MSVNVAHEREKKEGQREIDRNGGGQCKVVFLFPLSLRQAHQEREKKKKHGSKRMCVFARVCVWR